MDTADQELLSKCEYLGKINLYTNTGGIPVYDSSFYNLYVRKIFDKYYFYVSYRDKMLPVFDANSDPHIEYVKAVLYFSMPEL